MEFMKITQTCNSLLGNVQIWQSFYHRPGFHCLLTRASAELLKLLEGCKEKTLWRHYMAGNKRERIKNL